MKNKKMLPEYNFAKGVRGKYAKKYLTRSNLVVLSPDVSKIFKDSASVNNALRTLLKLTKSIKRLA